MRRRTLLLASGALAFTTIPGISQAQSAGGNAVRLGITLDPPGLDPTVSAASSIAEVSLYNIYETLTKIDSDGQVFPLLAQSWEVSDDLCSYTFHLRQDVSFHNGAAFNAQVVKFSLERTGAENSTNKDRASFSNIKEVHILDDRTVRLVLAHSDPDLLFRLGMATAIMVEPGSVENNRTDPVGTGPYRLHSWRKGDVISLRKWPQYRNAAQIQIEQASFKTISDASAQIAALLSGDIDVFARAGIARSLPTFEQQKSRFQVLVSNSSAKTLMAINNRKAPLNDVRVRRAIYAAIDRQTVIQAAADGYGQPIGSHYVSSMPGYVDTTDINPYNPALAKELLAQAGIRTPLSLSFILPPAPYARQGGEIIAAMLAQVGIQARIQNVEWAQWLSGVYTNHDFDLSMVSHVEPLDLDSYTQPGYYWGYESQAFDELYAQIRRTAAGGERNQLLAQAQRMLAHDAVNVWLYQPQWITVADARLQGLWANMPIFVNDLSAMSWR